MWPFKKKEIAPLNNLQATKWAENAMRRGGKGLIPDDPILVGLMYSVTRMNGPEISETAIFEMGCFVLSSIELWLSSQRPSSREKLISILMCRFTELYTQIFQMDSEKIASIVEQRLYGYREMNRSNLDIEKIIDKLTQAMLFSEANGKPSPYELGKGPMELDALKIHAIKSNIIAWWKNVFPIVMNIVGKGCDAME